MGRRGPEEEGAKISEGMKSEPPLCSASAAANKRHRVLYGPLDSPPEFGRSNKTFENGRQHATCKHGARMTKSTSAKRLIDGGYSFLHKDNDGVKSRC